MKKYFILYFFFSFSFLYADSLAVKIYKQAIIKVKQNKLRKAHSLFKQVIERSPYFVKGHYGLGRLYLYQLINNKSLNKTIRLINNNQKYKNQDAIKILGKVIIKKIKYLKSRRENIAREYFNEIIIEQAIKELQIAVKLDPGYADAYFYMGIAYMFSRNYNEALSQFKKASQLDRSLVEALYNSATIYELINDNNNALYFYKKYYYEKYLVKHNLDRKKYPFKIFIFPNVKI